MPNSSCTLESVVGWLLEESNPSIRYFTLRDIFGKNADDSELLIIKQAISSSDSVKKIMQKQRPEGHWELETSPYLLSNDRPMIKGCIANYLTFGL